MAHRLNPSPHIHTRDLLWPSLVPIPYPLRILWWLQSMLSCAMPWRRKPARHLRYWSGPVNRNAGFKTILVFCLGPAELKSYHERCHHNGRLKLSECPNGTGAISALTFAARNAVRSAGLIPGLIGRKLSTSTRGLVDERKRPPNPNQSITNATAQPNANKRPQSSSDSSIFSGFFCLPFPLITVWLQVRVLPGPPRFALGATRGAAARGTKDEACPA